MTNVISALRSKRTDIAEQVKDAERRLTKLRVALANLDAAINILTPDHPDAIPDRKYLRTHHFETNELPRMVREALRDATKPISAGEIAAAFVIAKGLPRSAHQSVAARVAMFLGKLGAKGEAVRTGKTRKARWSVMREP